MERGRRSHGEDYPGIPHGSDPPEPYAVPGSPGSSGERGRRRARPARRDSEFFASSAVVRAGIPLARSQRP